MDGNREALEALRAREGRQSLKGNTLTGKRKNTGSEKPDSITKKGTIIYSAAGGAIRDDGTQLKISAGAEEKSLQIALQMAMKRYGNPVQVNGTDAFREKIVQAAVSAKLPVTFDDPTLERQRLEKLEQQKKQEHQERLGQIRTRSQGKGRNR